MARSTLDVVLIAWFAMSSAIGVLIDSGIVSQGTALGEVWPPTVMVNALQYWAELADPLLLARPMWYQVAIYIEMVFQVPFCCAALYAFINKCEWIRIPGLVYGIESLTAMAFILAETFAGDAAVRTKEPALFLAVYSSYIFMPLIIAWRCSGTTMWTPHAKHD